MAARGTTDSPRESFADAFWSNLVIIGGGCWEWLRALNEHGYGVFRSASKNLAHGIPEVLAHRVAWHLTHGPIPDGLFVCHHCDNRKCVKPDHLFIGTARDNALDMVRKGRQVIADQRGDLHPGRKLSSQDVIAIRAARASGEQATAIARRYGVNYRTIIAACTGKTWAHI